MYMCHVYMVWVEGVGRQMYIIIIIIIILYYRLAELI